MKKFIYNYIEPGDFIVSHHWASYDWIDEDENYTLRIHNHANVDFGSGLESTSHIESLWGNL